MDKEPVTYQQPLVSVVMATYNGERFISEAIASVLNQTFTDFEFIIVDDGSKDTTPDIIASFNDARIIYIRKEKNSGIADSLNLGISKSKGVFIARMDDDDICLPQRLLKQVGLMQERPELILCASSVKSNKDRHQIPNHQCHEDLQIGLLFNNVITHPTVMIQRKVFEHNHYNSNMVPSEDYDLWSRLIFKGQFYKIGEPLLHYRYRPDSETSTRRQEQLTKNIAITGHMFNNYGFSNLPNHNENIRIFSGHDYTISGKSLSGLVTWFEALMNENRTRQIFSVETFNSVATSYLERYLIAFFTNRRLSKKMVPFLGLKLKYKKVVLEYYKNKFFMKKR